MGRATYEVGQLEGVTSPYPTLEQYVFSRSMDHTPDEAVTLVKTSAVERVRELRAGEGKLFGQMVEANRLALGEVRRFESGHLILYYARPDKAPAGQQRANGVSQG